MNEILITVLTIAGIAVLGYLALVLKSIYSILDNINETIEGRALEIDKIVTEIPEIMASVQDLTDNTNVLVSDIDKLIADTEGDITGIVQSVNGVMTDVNNITAMADDVATDVYMTTESVKDTVNSFRSGISKTPGLFRKKSNGIFDYIMIAKDFVTDVRNILNS